MKTTILIAAVASLNLLVSGAQPRHEISVAASPKTLMQFEQKAAKAVAMTTSSMSCPKCKDTLVARPDLDSKGLGARTLMSKGVPRKLVPKHLCPACATEWAVTGHGKAKNAVSTHKCMDQQAKQYACCR